MSIRYPVITEGGYVLRACSALALAAMVSGCTTAYEGKYEYAEEIGRAHV